MRWPRSQCIESVKRKLARETNAAVPPQVLPACRNEKLSNGFSGGHINLSNGEDKNTVSYEKRTRVISNENHENVDLGNISGVYEHDCSTDHKKNVDARDDSFGE